MLWRQAWSEYLPALKNEEVGGNNEMNTGGLKRKYFFVMQ